ncbi:putative 2OG-Fe(II) oxygenase [Nevskia sp.]|uniref:putative 2OG-Fe(II) oxygenase n=1 Tax=Nevskia sp. TaxID=1929292 RepID=UPI0025D4CD2E|nr:putative 2OG-Fe(II) oxygenase [Nevskia sp.]
MAVQLSAPFAVPFGFSEMPDAPSLNAELRTLFLAREAAGSTYANAQPTMKINPSLFESRFDLFRWPDPCIRRLREFCWSQLHEMIGHTTALDAAAMQALVGHADAWFHITRRGGWFAQHNHPMASWSGVYCVDAGRDDGSRRDSGLLSFTSPTVAASMYVDAANKALRIPFSHDSREFRLQPGQLVLFPSWLVHQVTPFAGDGERITVAFNAWFTVRDGSAR